VVELQPERSEELTEQNRLGLKFKEVSQLPGL
jgi:hypothetical protein